MKKLTLRRETLRALRVGEVGRVRGGWYKSGQCQEECTQLYSGCNSKSHFTDETLASCDCDGR